MKKRDKVVKARRSNRGLHDTKPEFYFKLVDGNRIKNLYALANAMEKMPDWVFYHHSNQQRNDFSNWIWDIFRQKRLAEDMSKAQSRLEAQVTLLKHIVSRLKK